MTDRETWLSTIRANPSDWQAMLVFADWLEEEEGDLLAAEQWRWIAAVTVNLDLLWMGAAEQSFVREWPTHPHFVAFPKLHPQELKLARQNNIRCMPHYPLTIEDVQAYLETAR